MLVQGFEDERDIGGIAQRLIDILSASYTIDGAAYIRDINKALEWELPSDGPKTLNGLITEILEFIPEGGVCIQVGPYYLETLEIKDNRISRARLWAGD